MNILYRIGLETYTAAASPFKTVGQALRPLSGLLRAGFEKTVLSGIHRFGQEKRKFKADVKEALRRMKEAEGISGAFFVLRSIFMAGCRRNKAFLKSVLNMVMPVGALAVLCLTVGFWFTHTFALEIVYQGEVIGLVLDEAQFNAAADMAIERVIDEENQFTVDRMPKFSMKMVNEEELTPVATLCDRIIQKSDIEIKEGCGVYVDGRFVAALNTKSEVDGILQGLLEEPTQQSPDAKVSFENEVVIKGGLYPVNSIHTEEELKEKLAEKKAVEQYYTVVEGDAPEKIARRFNMSLNELESLNPNLEKLMFPEKDVLVAKAQSLLSLKITKKVVYNREVAYSTEKKQDAKKDTSYSKITTAGQNGSTEYEDEVTYIDGSEVTRTNLRKTVLKAPVNEVVVVGTKKNTYYSAGSVSRVADSTQAPTGKFIWPVAGGYTSAGWGDGRGHTAMDIAAPKGTSIYASDAGTVVHAGYSGNGLGIYVEIKHANGYTTKYAHMSAVNCVVGQKVSQGQVIGYVGSTGQSTGNHCHFEIRINGVAINPAREIGSRGR